MICHIYSPVILIVFTINICLSLPVLNENFFKRQPNNDTRPWFGDIQNHIRSKLINVPNTNKAKNIIMFLGDGMSITTVTAARIFRGQKYGMYGEDSSIIFDEFPYTGLSKTYCLDKQVSDSASTGTAFLGGVKANTRTLGVNGMVKLFDCDASLNPDNHVRSIAAWAQDAGMNTGIVTTTRITHATPAASYGHSANRDWEDDEDVIGHGYDPTKCKDLAMQLITGEVGKKFKVILGGGRRGFLPNTTKDPDGPFGNRQDGRDLTELWREMKASEGLKAAHVTNRDEMMNAAGMTDYMLGLFHHTHIPFHLLFDEKKHPRLAEMTSVAIDLLSKNDAGFFLLVEGGRIDMGHHENSPQKALDETIEFAEAVKVALEKTGEDTLIVVTSDHGHTMSYTGDVKRGDNILTTLNKAKDGSSYTTLQYANGPGYRGLVNGTKFNISPENINDAQHRFSATVPLELETHGGEDVLVFAQGPWSHLFSGSFEQNYIPHAMAYAACIGSGRTACFERST